jgi:hypothetical protein
MKTSIAQIATAASVASAASVAARQRMLTHADVRSRMLTYGAGLEDVGDARDGAAWG